jgi:uncharacterized protein (TIGR02600 family)
MPDPLQKPKRQKPNAVEGTALVIVLSCLVLLATLAITLLNRVESDRSSSASYRGGTQTKNLADYAINVVMAQINSATADPALAWASQPGAIRTYSATGSNLVNIYKLYSSTNMVVNAFPAGDITALANWAASPALFTDLNAPIITKSGSSTNTNYPILDPSATNSVQGFAISGAPTSTIQPAPMPVTWLYVLQDGNLVAPTGSGSTATVAGASPANPIISRIAFWADDDTCKVNVNTASGMPWSWATNNPNNGPAPTLIVGTAGATNTTLFGNFWDTPILGNYQDDNLAYSQPWRSEYQRYPGHPATVSLSAVFTNLSTNDIMAISPRINYQNNLGSLWGTVTSINGINTNTIPSDGARLYANADELLYATNRSSINANGPDNPLTTTQIEQGRFFLTASSRAPDVTLFNTPRLLCWPINTSTNKQTPYDNLIAFCGTLPTGSANTYFFQRSDAYSPTVDYNANSRLLGYLRRMTTTAVPGFGGSGILNKSAYSADTEQITTEIFDYIRCINLQDTSVTNNPAKFYSTNALVVPSTGASGTRGFGRIPTITKAGMLFWYDTNSVSGGVTNTLLCARLVMETFVPGHGYPHITNTVGYSNVVSGLTGGFQWGTNTNSMQNIFSSNTATYTLTNSKAFTNQVLGGRISITASLDGATNTGSPLFPTNNPTNALYFKGGDISVTTYYNGNVIQVINNLNFPDLTNSPLPLPTANANANFNRPTAWASTRRGNANWDVTLATNDVVRSVQFASGDFRMTAAQASVNAATSYTNHPRYFDTSLTNGYKAHSFTYNSGFYEGAGMITNAYYNTNATTLTNVPQGISGNGPPGAISGVGGDMITNSTNGGASFLMRYGDFDNGYGVWPDGPYIGFADEGMSSTVAGYSGVPYYTTGANIGFSSIVVTGRGYFSPNRLVPSAGIMGSLSTGVMANSPWQTLLFRPAALTSANHPGLANPPDYLLLDLFNMPVVEPYAISEPLSTAGRVNMNYQILPFTWIKRSTAVQAALHTEILTAIPNGLGASRKNWNSVTTTKSRFPLNLSTNGGTLQGFENRFAANDIFRSAAEICSIPLVPYGAGASYSAMSNWWAGYTYTGENSKERPYARIYPKLTTKSNTYTVHYRVEVLKQSPNSTVGTWNEGTDKVVSTYRGSTTIERYVNPRDPSIPDYASQNLPLNSTNALPYKFRILADRHFNP